MTTVGLTILVAAGATSFTLALVIVLVPMNVFLRASLISIGFSGWFVLPFVAPGHDMDIAAAYWFGVALWAVGAWLVGLVAGLLARLLVLRRRDRTTPNRAHT